MFNKACLSGDADACVGVGVLLANGEGVEPDVARARAMFERACAQDNAEGCIKLALIYDEGMGGLRDDLRARDPVIRAGRQSESESPAENRQTEKQSAHRLLRA